MGISQVFRVLDERTLEQMHAAALEILAQTGLQIEHPDLRAAILTHQGFQVSNERICISSDRITAWREAMRANPCALPTLDETPRHLTGGVDDRCTWIADRDGITIRPLTREDVIAGTKLVHVLAERGLRGSTPGIPGDVPQRLQPLEQYLIGAEYAATGGATTQVCDIPTARIIRKMDRVYGRPYHASVYLISPLKLAGTELEILWHFREEVAAIEVGSMPIMGLTGPCDPIAVATLALAETLGSAAVLHTLFPGIPITIFPHPEPADLRTGAIAFGTPEWQLLDLMHRDILYYYGSPWNVKLSLTTASLPGAQAQIERGSSMLLAALGGFAAIGPLGQLSNDEVWSPAQLLLDLDMLAYAERVARGVAVTPPFTLDSLPALVQDVVSSGELFAEHDSTILHMRQQYQQPAVLQRLARSQWEDAGRPDLLQAAWAQADALVAEYAYEPPQDILRDLRAIYTKGREELG